ncbi:putative mucin-5B [Apostichopus japonicus]|uniref:Putative mucin-5B n=1 Tax=Stichopus japonicus TaxID=307972 RepID=A0A2G8K5Y0_STIJA|nr:putative mucin-5B [Apostichopus japonicus]
MEETTTTPSTAAPTTTLPSTAAPTTTAPSTAAPTTTAPSTAAPTTTTPSTAAPTTTTPSTAAPTTTTPSTAAPTTTTPSTAAPTTTAPISTSSLPTPQILTFPTQTNPQQQKTTECYVEVCEWTDWEDDENGGKVDYSKPKEEESIDDMKQQNQDICGEAVDIECRIQSMPDFPFEDITGQEVTCDLTGGLVCLNDLQQFSFCHNYEARIRCCRMEPCGTTPVVTTTSPTTTTVPTTTVVTTEQSTTTLPTTVPKTPTTNKLTTTVLPTTHGTTRKYEINLCQKLAACCVCGFAHTTETLHLP